MCATEDREKKKQKKTQKRFLLNEKKNWTIHRTSKKKTHFNLSFIISNTYFESSILNIFQLTQTQIFSIEYNNLSKRKKNINFFSNLNALDYKLQQWKQNKIDEDYLKLKSK